MGGSDGGCDGESVDGVMVGGCDAVMVGKVHPPSPAFVSPLPFYSVSLLISLSAKV